MRSRPGLKIAFTGAGGTGKTTIAKKLAESLDVPFIQSPSRACFEKHGVRTEDEQLRMTEEAKLALQMDIFHAIDSQVMSTTEGVFDRTHLDNFFYACHRCHGLIDTETVKLMMRQTFKGLRSFSHIFFAPIYQWSVDAPNDGMRTQSFAGRFMMEAFIKNFLHTYRMDFDILPDADVNWRLMSLEMLFAPPSQENDAIMVDNREIN